MLEGECTDIGALRARGYWAGADPERGVWPSLCGWPDGCSQCEKRGHRSPTIENALSPQARCNYQSAIALMRSSILIVAKFEKVSDTA